MTPRVLRNTQERFLCPCKGVLASELPRRMAIENFQGALSGNPVAAFWSSQIFAPLKEALFRRRLTETSLAHWATFVIAA